MAVCIKLTNEWMNTEYILDVYIHFWFILNDYIMEDWHSYSLYFQRYVLEKKNVDI